MFFRRTVVRTDMGMITRVRRRLRLNSVVNNRERTAQSVCLLSALLLLPYCPRGPLRLLPSPASLLYTVVVLPMIFGANYSYPISTFKTLARFVEDSAERVWCPISNFSRQVYVPVDRAENLFLRMKNISVLTNQIVFLMLADRLLIARSKTSCLYTLMFYNVIAYCVDYVKELVNKEDWSPYITLTERSNIKHLAMSATKIVLEWTKAVTFVVTFTFVLLVFGLEQALENYRPSTLYTLLTWSYYASTEKVFVDMFPNFLRLFQLEVLENIEEVYAPVISRCFGIAASALCILTLIPIPTTSWKFLLIASYVNVYLRSKELALNSGAALRREWRLLHRYRKATFEEIERFDDVCAVCLCSMTKARITPCHHLFHAACLRECLKATDSCPMCKRDLQSY